MDQCVWTFNLIFVEFLSSIRRDRYVKKCVEERDKNFVAAQIANWNFLTQNEQFPIRHCFRPKRAFRVGQEVVEVDARLSTPLNGKRIFYMDGKDKDFFDGWVFDDEKISSAERRNNKCWLKTSILNSGNGTVQLFLF
ncbi:hypothetical protein B9Z55_027904 [Caenorhabditis nigoni]|uniref:Uncharacterized protein n=1 Tax=Caenorhabditis nigoni TaxID=1611254 RepID=A0A2G5SEG7_9PELO|nr:hypothetical protein B9Z55_027904 [Caenorhabditis nigoni]